MPDPTYGPEDWTKPDFVTLKKEFIALNTKLREIRIKKLSQNKNLDIKLEVKRPIFKMILEHIFMIQVFVKPEEERKAIYSTLDSERRSMVQWASKFMGGAHSNLLSKMLKAKSLR